MDLQSWRNKDLNRLLKKQVSVLPAGSVKRSALRKFRSSKESGKRSASYRKILFIIRRVSLLCYEMMQRENMYFRWKRGKGSWLPEEDRDIRAVLSYWHNDSQRQLNGSGTEQKAFWFCVKKEYRTHVFWKSFSSIDTKKKLSKILDKPYFCMYNIFCVWKNTGARFFEA